MTRQLTSHSQKRLLKGTKNQKNIRIFWLRQKQRKEKNTQKQARTRKTKTINYHNGYQFKYIMWK